MAIVDVDVRGWIYSPHKGPTTRKQRLMIGLARQLSGIPAPPATSRSGDNSRVHSRASSPSGSTRASRQEEDLITLEADHILRKGDAEAKMARRGAFSEIPRDSDDDSLYGGRDSRNGSPERGRQSSSDPHRLYHVSTASSDAGGSGSITPLQKRPSWTQPAKMSSAELAVANAHLLTRLKPFMANPLANTPISAFFYSSDTSRQKTVYTDTSGHFTCRAGLDFIPTHVRILAGEKLSATEEVHITAERGVSLISDIDDTIKHSAISAGAREIFRNAFIRDLNDLTIDGVREWYTTLHDMGVKMHYVSNSPWQMFPIITNYFRLAELPIGSFHLKQYSGMLQGIFEPVAERKKGSLDKIMRDFPDRKFILVGDSGEADLEVYTDVVIDNPGRILGVFIRDVTTPQKTGYFDPSNGAGGKKHERNHSRHQSGDSLAMSKRLSRPEDIREDDAELRQAIAASLADMENEARQSRRSINPDAPREPRWDDRPQLGTRSRTERPTSGGQFVASPEEDLIDFGEETPTPSKPWLAPPTDRRDLHAKTINGDVPDYKKPVPSPHPPPKPHALRSPSPNLTRGPSSEGSPYKPPPPRPRKPSSAVKPPSPQPPKPSEIEQPQPAQALPPHLAKPSPLSQVTRQDSTKDRPPLPTRPNTYRGIAKQKISNAYNALPAAANYWHGDTGTGQPRSSNLGYETPRSMSTSSQRSYDELRTQAGGRKIAPPPPPRRANTGQSFSTVTNRRSGSEHDGGGGSPDDSISKKEQMWRERLSRAKAIMDRQGVTLRTWRVGSDVAHVCITLVEMEMREIEREEKTAGGRRGAVGDRGE